MFELNWADVVPTNTVIVGESKGTVITISDHAVTIQWDHLDTDRTYTKAEATQYGFVFCTA